MSLTILTTGDERLVGTAIVEQVRSCEASGRVTVLAPSFAVVLQVQKELAAFGLCLGVEVSTPQAWARDQWDLWGDGRRVIGDAERRLVMTGVLDAARRRGDAMPSSTPGTVELLCSLAEQSLPWLGEALRMVRERDAAQEATTFSQAELQAFGLLEAYGEALASYGIVEGAHAMAHVVGAMRESKARVPDAVFVGFGEMTHAQRTLAIELAREGRACVVLRADEWRECEQERRLVETLAAEAREAGVVVRRRCDNTAPYRVERDRELHELLGELYRGHPACLTPRGAVWRIEPAGPLAEAELLARELSRMVDEGCTSLVVAAADTSRAWRELAPKLVAHGMDVCAHLSVPVLSTVPGRAFMDFAQAVARLMALRNIWPEAQVGPEGTRVRLGSMDWWPPHELVDFLLCDISGVDARRAYALDVSWRTNRLLTPTDVLDSLLNARVTSDAVARATRELMRGRLGSAASRLLKAYMQAAEPTDSAESRESIARAEATGALAAILGMAGTLKDLGVSADESREGAVSLWDLVRQAEVALASVRVVLRPRVEAQRRQGTVLIVSRSEAASLPAGSADAVVVCGLTSQEYPVPATEDELAGMIAGLGLEPERDALVAQRSAFFRICEVARRQLALERTLFEADSHETFPAVMLTELLSCYEHDLPCATLSEDEARAHLSLRGVAPEPCAVEDAAPAGHTGVEVRRLVSVPPEGMPELEGGLPVLSASQLESYVECPLKWFSLRRLRLQDNDAGFGALEMGTFAHRVLELTYSQLFEEGRATLRTDDAEAMAHAHAVLDSCFEEHLAHQYMRSGTHTAYQALVAHSSQEESQVDRLRRDLSSALDYVARGLVGYEPRAFEWEFGRGEHTREQAGLPSLAEATYAGVRVTGTVDRIDVNAQGQALVIDYKHKSPNGFFGEYAAFPAGKKGSDAEFALPRRIQSLMYAQVVRKAFPDLRVVGALYLATRADHELSGAVAEPQADAAFGWRLSSRRAPQVVVDAHASFPGTDKTGMDGLLEATEQAVAQKVRMMREGHIEAAPIDAKACQYCPVSQCERRMEK